jgi:hypothetical protein
MYAIKFSQAISCINVMLKKTFLDTNSVYIIKVDMRNDHNSPLFISVSLVNATFLLVWCAAGGWSQLERSPLRLPVLYPAA